MEGILDQLRPEFDGVIDTSLVTRDSFSQDQSLYSLTPQAVVIPNTTTDVTTLVRTVTEAKTTHPDISVTVRGSGSDRSGGAIGQSILVSTQELSSITIQDDSLRAQAGATLGDIDKRLAKDAKQLQKCSDYTAERTIGGLVSSGALSDGVTELRVVLADGHVYDMHPLNRRQLDAKLHQHNYEGEIYRRLFELIDAHYDLIRNSKPRTTLNATGYNLWDVWDEATETFDLTKLFIASQGTLGIITEVTASTYVRPRYTSSVLTYVTSTRKLGTLLPLILRTKPTVIEGYDDLTLRTGLRRSKELRHSARTSSWLVNHTALLGFIMRPRNYTSSSVLTIEFTGDSQSAVDQRAASLVEILKKQRVSAIQEQRSANVVLKKLENAYSKHMKNTVTTAAPTPFMDDMIVPPKYIAAFLPEVRRILKHHKLSASIVGDYKNGNFHIVPLMKLGSPKAQAKLEPIMRELLPVIRKYNGSLSATQGDGMVRGPWLPAMYGTDMYQLFRKTKEIFDPLYIFNPHKKTDASWQFGMDHLRKK